MKIRFIEPGNPPYRPSVENLFVYNKYIRTPSVGMLTLATVVNEIVDDTLMYSESISKIVWKDVLDADIVFIGIFTFSAPRGYELADHIMSHSGAVVVIGGLHASLNYSEAVHHCHYVLLGECEESILEFIQVIDNNRFQESSFSPGFPDATDFQNFPGIAYLKGDEVVCTGGRKPPENINIIPDRYLAYKYRKMTAYNTIWSQVHASRGCPHSCDYCAVVRHFGRKVRTRTPENIIEDVRQSIAFHGRRGGRRPVNVLWFTDDNFFADRAWAVSVLHALISSGIKYRFTIQARYEIGFDDEMLKLLAQAGFFEIAMGIEFLEDESFEKYHKNCNYDDLVKSIRNIQKHGINVRGLFIVGAEQHTKGIGDKLADFVIEHGISGVLIQSMYFVPGTPAYEENKGRLLHRDWSKYTGNVVHRPPNITPRELQREIIHASRKIYSGKRLLQAIFKSKGINKLLFIGEYLWHSATRANLKRELRMLEE